MHTYNNLTHLEQFGIVPLTGEADSLCFRILCDLTAGGRRIVAECFGLNETGFQENWNTGRRGDPHVASVMLTNDHVTSLAIIAIVTRNRTAIATYDRGVHELEDGEDWKQAEGHWDDAKGDFVIDKLAQVKLDTVGDWMDWNEAFWGKVKRVYNLAKSRGNHPGSGTRNTHAMSGRTN